MAGRGLLRPGGGRVATVLFLDVEGFTAIAELMPPEEVITMLDGFFEAVARVVARHGGVVISFMGDEVVATPSAPLEDPDHAAHAPRAALEVATLARERAFGGVRLGRAGRRQHGAARGGERGRRRAYTVYGDAVNLAARLEALNKEHGTRLLVAEATARACAAAAFRFREVGVVAVGGRRRPVRVYTVDG